MRTPALVSLVASLAGLCACNSFLGIDDVSLANDGGAEPDAPGDNEDAAVDAMLVTETFGFPQELDETIDLPEDIVIGRAATALAGAWRVVEFGFIAKGDGGDVAMGLYGDNGNGNPGVSLGFSEIAAARAGVNSLPGSGTFDTAVDGAELWIMLVSDGVGVPLAGDTGVQVASCAIGRQFDAMPLPGGSFGATGCPDDDAVNVYVVVTPDD